MKKLLAALLSLLLVAGCSTKIQGGDLNDINKRGYIIVAMEGTWAPWTYHDEADNLVGYDVEVGKYIADYLGVDVQYAEGEWDGLLAGVEAGRYDMMINGCDVTDKRKEVYDFSDAYVENNVIVVITTKDNEDIKKMEDLKGKVTANTASSTYASIAEEYGATVKPVDSLNDTFMALERGTIDATVNSESAFNDYIKAKPDANIKIACYYEDAPEIAIAMKKGSSELVSKVNEAIAAAKADGTIAKLSDKYFGEGSNN